MKGKQHLPSAFPEPFAIGKGEMGGDLGEWIAVSAFVHGRADTQDEKKEMKNKNKKSEGKLTSLRPRTHPYPPTPLPTPVFPARPSAEKVLGTV
jgi:hypothetical protein